MDKKEKRYWANIQYMAGVDRRRKVNRTKKCLKAYGKDNQGANNRAGKCKPFRSLPPEHRPIAQEVFIRLWRRAKRQGKPLTQQKIGSMMGNAVYITKYLITSNKTIVWTKTFHQRRMFLQRYLSKMPEAKRPEGSPRTSIHLTGV